MKAERETAGFAIPFIAGTAITLSLLSQHVFISALIPSTALSLAATCAIVLSGRAYKILNTPLLYLLILTAAVCCGIFTGYTGGITSICNSGAEGMLYRFLTQAGEGFKAKIADIEFTDPQTNAIITALLSGDRSLLSPETKAIFRESGASHILALSGLHIGIIYGILRGLSSPLGNSRKAKVTKAGITICLCGFYTAMTGAGASIVRAFLFIVLSEIATLTGRFRSTGSLLLSCLIIQTVIDPTSLKDIGFQLSYLAMAGIAFIFPYLKKLWPKQDKKEGLVSKGLRWIWNMAAMSISCQITTGPVAWLYFGTFPQYFLLTNIIAMPLTGIIIPTSILITFLDSCGICPAAAIQGTELLISCLRESLTTISAL